MWSTLCLFVGDEYLIVKVKDTTRLNYLWLGATKMQICIKIYIIGLKIKWTKIWSKHLHTYIKFSFYICQSLTSLVLIIYLFKSRKHLNCMVYFSYRKCCELLIYCWFRLWTVILSAVASSLNVLITIYVHIPLYILGSKIIYSATYSSLKRVCIHS